jgi:uncharacterized protein YqgC (DUF456 family)
VEYVDEDTTKMLRGMVFGMDGDTLKENTKSASQGILIGGVIGGFTGLYIRSSIVLFTLIGAVTGLAISHYSNKK